MRASSERKCCAAYRGWRCANARRSPRSTRPGSLRHALLKLSASAPSPNSAACTARTSTRSKPGAAPQRFDTVIELAQALDVDPITLTTLDGDRLPLSGIRLRRRISRVELAEHTDVSYHLWWQIETGRRNLTDALARRAAVVLDVDVDELHEALRLEIAGHESRT